MNVLVIAKYACAGFIGGSVMNKVSKNEKFQKIKSLKEKIVKNIRQKINKKEKINKKDVVKKTLENLEKKYRNDYISYFINDYMRRKNLIGKLDTTPLIEKYGEQHMDNIIKWSSILESLDEDEYEKLGENIRKYVKDKVGSAQMFEDPLEYQKIFNNYMEYITKKTAMKEINEEMRKQGLKVD